MHIRHGGRSGCMPWHSDAIELDPFLHFRLFPVAYETVTVPVIV